MGQSETWPEVVQKGPQENMGSESDWESGVGFREAGEAVGSVNKEEKPQIQCLTQSMHSINGSIFLPQARMPTLQAFIL